MTKAVISVTGLDATGIIAKVATKLSELNINILDITQTILGGYFTMMMVVDLDGAQATFVIDRSGEEDVVLRDGQSVDAEAFKAAFQAVNVVPVNGFTSAEEVAEAPAVLTLTYVFSGEEEPYTVTYLDSSINNYALRKNDSVSVTVSKDACADMLAQLRALLA